MSESDPADAIDAVLDDSAWPLVVASLDGRADAAVASVVAAALDSMLDRAAVEGVKVKLVLDLDRLDRGARTVVDTWMAERMERLAQHVAATATVVAPATVARNRELTVEYADHYPFAVWCAGSVDECCDWLEDLDA